MKNVIIIGGATQDIFMYLHENEFQNFVHDTIPCLLFEEGSKIGVKKIHYASGGGATNVAAALKLLEYEPFPLFKVVNDTAGNFIINDLKNRSITTRFVITESSKTEVSTGTSCIIPTPSGNRIIFAYRGIGATLMHDDITWEHLPKSSGLYITALAGDAAKHLPTLVKSAHNHTSSLMVAINPGKHQLKGDITSLFTTLPMVTLFMLNEEEAKILYATLQQLNKDIPQEFTIEIYCKTVLQYGPKIIVVTCGACCVYAATHEKIYYHKAIHTNATSSVGAGDAFGATFFAAILSEYDIETALKHGVINSASVVQAPDAKSGLLSLDEIKKRSLTLSA